MIQLFIKGIVIGIANIIPGVSGGTLAVVLGVYDKMTEAIGNFPIVSWKKRVDYGKFLLNIGIGAICGIILFARIVEYLVTYYPKLTAGIFTLLILPSIPYIVKGENKKDKGNILFFILGALIALAFVMLDYYYGGNIQKGELANTLTVLYLLKLFICGGVAAGAMIIPGISGSMLLLMLGEYYNVLGFINKFFQGVIKISTYSSIFEAIEKLYLIPLFFFGLGIVLGLVVIAKIMSMLLSKYRSATLFFITGIIVVSIVQIWINVFN